MQIFVHAFNEGKRVGYLEREDAERMEGHGIGLCMLMQAHQLELMCNMVLLDSVGSQTDPITTTSPTTSMTPVFVTNDDADTTPVICTPQFINDDTPVLNKPQAVPRSLIDLKTNPKVFKNPPPAVSTPYPTSFNPPPSQHCTLPVLNAHHSFSPLPTSLTLYSNPQAPSSS